MQVSAKEDSANKRRFVPKLRTSLIPMALTALMIVGVGMAGYFVLQYIRASSFQEGRAFRVLDEVAQQFDNMQGSMASLLTLVPESLGCPPAASAVDTYVRKLDLADLKLEVVKGKDGQPIRSPKDRGRRYDFEVRLEDARRPFTIRPHAPVIAEGAEADKGECIFQISGNFKQHLPAFANQRYFDEVLLALPNGVILATITNRETGNPQVKLQEDTSEGAIVADARLLLARAAVAEQQAGKFTLPGKDADDGLVPGALPSHATAFAQSIAEQTYAISVLPTLPASEILSRKDADASRPPEHSQTLYLIGLKREDLASQASDALGSGGAFAATIAVLLGILLWPFLSLRLSPADSAIAGFQVFGIVISLLLLPIVLTSSAMWIWSQVCLRAWADAGAETYAAQLEKSLTAELDEAAWLLHQYSALGAEPTGYPKHAPIRRAADGTTKQAMTQLSQCDMKCPDESSDKQCTKQLNAACRIFLVDPAAATSLPLRNWSPLRTSVLLQPNADSVPPRISAFGDVPVKNALNLSDRKYFQALREGQPWTPRSATPWEARRTTRRPALEQASFVAQRLFNRADAARVLQIAVPRSLNETWNGIITGDTRAYSLSAGVRPPLLRYAVIDRENGEVLFHTDDERSLSENLLVESGRNPRLRQAMLTHRSNWPAIDLMDHFSGQYLGESHRFYYRPVSGIPWGIVVYYSTETLSDIAFDAAIASLAQCISILTLLIMLIVAAAFFWNKRIDRYLLAAAWPQWEWRCHYPRIAVTLSVFWLFLIVAISFGLRSQNWSWPLVAIAVAAGVCVWMLVKSRARFVRKPGIGSYRFFYTSSAVAAICVLVITPAWLTAIGYQDLSTSEYLRGQLFQASLDVERRERLMDRDLRRWVPDDTDRRTKYPDGATLARSLPVPAYTTAPAPCKPNGCFGWTLTTFSGLPWLNAAGPAEPGWFRRYVWRSVTLSNPQRSQNRRAAVLRGAAGQSEERTTSDAASATDRSDLVQMRQGSTLLMALGHTDEPFVRSLEPCQPGADECLRISEDVLHRDRWSSFNTALLLSALLVLLLVCLVAMVARRLCGIRIPFAPRFIDPPDPSLPFGALVSTELLIDQARAEFPDEFTSKDAINIRRIASAPHYRDVWRSLSADERHLLHQLALGHFANPENDVIVERLLHRGYIRLRPWPVITDQGLAEFARTAPGHEEFIEDRLQWASAAAGSTWHRIRIPLLSGGLMIAVGLMIFAGGAMQILLTSLAGVAALLGHVTQVTNFVRRGDSKPG